MKLDADVIMYVDDHGMILIHGFEVVGSVRSGRTLRATVDTATRAYSGFGHASSLAAESRHDRGGWKSL